MNYPNLLARHPIISDQIGRPALGVVLRELETVLARGIAGDIAEFGCYIGTTSLFMRRLLDEMGLSDHRQLYAYDSFVGLPEKTAEDDSPTGVQFKVGELIASKKQLLRQFYRAGLTPPLIYKGWFNELGAEQLPKTLAYAFLDGDFYESIIDSLELAWPRLVSGGVITVDDYQRPALPGVERALVQFFRGKPASWHGEHNIAIIKKP